MAPLTLPPLPPALKSIQHYLKIASDYDTRDPPVSYWSRLHAFQQGLTLKKSKEDMAFLMLLMDWLEKTKLELKTQETVSDEIVAQAHIENAAIKLFLWADSEDRAGRYNKNVVKAFYSAGMLLDVCAVFGELSEDVAQQKKYAKWRAAHLHNCLNSGEQPSEPAPKPDDQVLNDSENMEYGLPATGQPSQPMPDHSRYPGESGGAMAMPTPQQPSIPQATVSIPTLGDVATEFQRQYANLFQMAEQHVKALEESQHQVKDQREQLDAADKQIKYLREQLDAAEKQSRNNIEDKLRVQENLADLKSQRSWLIKYVKGLTPAKLKRNLLLPLVRIHYRPIRRFRGVAYALIAARRLRLAKWKAMREGLHEFRET